MRKKLLSVCCGQICMVYDSIHTPSVFTANIMVSYAISMHHLVCVQQHFGYSAWLHVDKLATAQY